MYKFCVFAGTTEGRTLVEYLANRREVSVMACLATEYGETLLPRADNLRVSAKRLDKTEMAALLEQERFDLVLDATHPYAAAVTENLSDACAAAGTPYQRVLREDSLTAQGMRYLPDIPAAAAWLSEREGNILLTTGSKELSRFREISGFAERVYARVLPMESSLAACREAGLPPAHIIAMQGPFTKELNVALLRALGAKFLVTKDSGPAGGFPEKAAAAEETGAELVVLGRPPQLEGKRLGETLLSLSERFGLPLRTRVTVAGIGPGGPGGMTGEVKEAAAAADCLIGAQRMLSALASPGQPRFAAVAPETIAEFILSHREFRNVAVLMSGDTGFYSGTKKLLPLLSDCEVRVLPGLSSLSCLSARLGISYEDAVPVSLHGRERDIVSDVRRNGKVFALTGGENGAGELCRRLTEAGLGGVSVHVGERLGYPEERVSSGTAAELETQKFDSLSAVLIENPTPLRELSFGLPDAAFGRAEKVPMTKSEVRAVCLSRLRLTEDAVCWDVGAGTGSVSVEMALNARQGRVYAIERNENALAALRNNAARFSLGNLIPVPGAAPDCCGELPAPSRVFIGGSGGNLREIIALVLQKNPAARIVAAAVTLESLAELNGCRKAFSFAETECVCLTAARDTPAGPYHLMTGLNPVYIFTLQGAAETK